MSASFATLSAIPSSFVQGEAITWSETLPSFDGSLYTVAYKLLAETTPMDGLQQLAIASATNNSGTSYSFTTPASAKPGIYKWQRQVTRRSDSLMREDARGTTTIRANDATAQTQTFEARQVELLQGVIAAFSSNSQQSVSFNGQSFSRASIADYQKQIVFYQAAVLRQQAALAALNACAQQNRIGVEFVPSGGNYPVGHFYPGFP